MADSGNLVFADHVEAHKMGQHVRVLRFPEHIALRSVRVLGRGQQLGTDYPLEGKSFPDLRTMSLSVFAVDRESASSTMPRLIAGETELGTFLPPKTNFITNCIVLRGEYLRVTLAVFGRKIPASQAPPDGLELQVIPAYLRPTAALEETRLDLPDFEGGGEDEFANLLDANGEVLAAALADKNLPGALEQALSLGSEPEANRRLADLAEWVAELPDQLEPPKADDVISKLEEIVTKITTMARQTSSPSAAHVSCGPDIALALHRLASRCLERLDFELLEAVVKTLSATLCAASTAAEVIRHGGIVQLLTMAGSLAMTASSEDWANSTLRVVALEAVLQLCSFACGMEALCGWSDFPLMEQLPGSGYEIVLEILVKGSSVNDQMETLAKCILKRASFYQALAGFEAACSKLNASASDDTSKVREERLTFAAAVEALTIVADMFDELSREEASPPATSKDESLVEEFMSKIHDSAGSSSRDGLNKDVFLSSYPVLHGYLASYFCGRRLIPSVCVLLRFFPRMEPSERIAAFEPLRRLLCSILACIGGVDFLAHDPHVLWTLLSFLESSASTSAGNGGVQKSGSKEVVGIAATPRFPSELVRSSMGASELATLLNAHLRASKLTLLLAWRTRQSGSQGLLPQAEVLPVLAGLDQLLVQGSAGRDAVVCAFRSEFLVNLLLHQMECTLEAAFQTAGSVTAAAEAAPSVRHGVSILHTLLIFDTTAAVAERFGSRLLAVALRAMELLEARVQAGDSAEGGAGLHHGASLEFALESEGPEGGLGKAVRLGRRSADIACLNQLRQLVAQLKPWKAETDAADDAESKPVADNKVSDARLIACLELSGPPKAIKRSTHEERGSRIPLTLGGYCGVGASGVEVAEVEFSANADGGDGNTQEQLEERERIPPGDMSLLPLVAVRMLQRRASGSAASVLSVMLATSEDGGGKDSIASLVPVLIRCAGSLSLNLDALALKHEDDGDSVGKTYKSQYNHCQLLECTLKTCYYLLKGLKKVGVTQYRNTELMHVLLLLADRLQSGLVGANPVITGSNPEFRLLWRSCIIWTCSVFRVWVQKFPNCAGGQLLQPLLRYGRVLPKHFSAGLLLLATCGKLDFLSSTANRKFELVPGRKGAEETGVSADASVLQQSPSFLLPASSLKCSVATLISRATTGKKEVKKTNQGQIWSSENMDEDWEDSARMSTLNCDSLVRSLSKQPHTVAAAGALGLVARVNGRRERLCIADLAELTALVAQCSLTSDASVHLITVGVLEKLLDIGLPVLEAILQLAEAALSGFKAGSAGDVNNKGGEAAHGEGVASGAEKEPKDRRTLARILMLLAHFAERGPKARKALLNAKAESICQVVLAYNQAVLPQTATTSAVRILMLMYCSGSNEDAGEHAPGVPKVRMISKALSFRLNRTLEEDGGRSSASTTAAALELLNRLNSTKNMALNLLFTPSGEPRGSAVPVSVTPAFRLGVCKTRIVTELDAAMESLKSSPKGSEEAAEAEERVMHWMYIARLLVRLLVQVTEVCSNAAVLLNILSSGTPAMVDTVFDDFAQVLNKATVLKTQRGVVELQAIYLVRTAHHLVSQWRDLEKDNVSGSVPTFLQSQDLAPPKVLYSDPGAATGNAVDDPPSSDDSAVVHPIVAKVFEATAELEADVDWSLVAELDSAEMPIIDGVRQNWEFDGQQHRRKRQEAIQQAEAERQAKRQKPMSQLVVRVEPDDRRSSRRRYDDSSRNGPDSKSSRKGPPTSALTLVTNGSGPNTGAVAKSASVFAPAAPAAAGTNAAASAAAATSTAGAAASAAAAASPTPAAAAGGPQAEIMKALQTFTTEHPEFVKVIKNPKKLQDPRVKSMFLKELDNYPLVKQFMSSKGIFK